MAIATKQKPKAAHHKKRTAAHHRQTKHYVKSYWPYLPMVAIIAAGIFVNSLLNHPSAVLGEQSNLSQYSLLETTNENRAANERTGLVLNTQLQQAAQAKANDMVTKDYWAHTTPSGEQPWKFITAAGYQYQAAGENLAFGFDSAESLAKAWMQSSEHRANLLGSSYSQVGFGVAQSSDFVGHGNETVVVAMYATPSQSAVLPASTIAPEPVSITRMEAVASVPAVSGLIVGVIGTLAVIAVLFRHSFAWRRMLNHGEMFVIQHPLLDIVFVTVAVVAVLLNQTTGFIR